MANNSRRNALALLVGTSRWLRGAAPAPEAEAPVRFAISESLVTDVNLNDARAAMLIWIKRMSEELDVVIEYSPRVFDPTAEIVRRALGGLLDAVALNVVEYRQIAAVLDSGQIIAEADSTGLEQYLLVVKGSSGFQHIGEMKGRRLCLLKSPRMCVATAWLATILDPALRGQGEQFFGAVTAEAKTSRVVLPVFFGQTDACIVSRRGFDTMCELNPQVARDLKVIAGSPAMVVTFYVFHKNYHGDGRERFIRVYSALPATVAGRQLATLFQFENLVVKEGSCLEPALAILAAAERVRGRRDAGGRRG